MAKNMPTENWLTGKKLTPIDELLKIIEAARQDCYIYAENTEPGSLHNVQYQKAANSMYQAEFALKLMPRYECSDLTENELRQLRHWRDTDNGLFVWDNPNGSMPDELTQRGYLICHESVDYIHSYEFTNKAWAAVGRPNKQD